VFGTETLTGVITASGVWQVENKKPRFAYCKAGHVTWKNCAKRFYLPPQFSGCGADNSVSAVSLG
jgi:hypothetical protein